MTPDGQSEQGTASSATIDEALGKAVAAIEAAGCEDPRGDAEALVAFVLGEDDELSPEASEKLDGLVVDAVVQKPAEAFALFRACEATA